ncbi:ribosomal protein S18 acetylase RimI-like enzyme [Frondihabitans sp. PhB188]|uniref:GNAT family N-acetyltransferase n=1 Tax=Frondihabitans sp. PhB188 TaxID=2485200 RepID=UPI000F486D80|nr:GNAT family N-acetyltransferase [Frondihabitans sp. PhB188]ROQ39790.1 ribosomal protein S18 acetylase RimI-like enzyme [Frondihabitans sp. PhB188]
MHSSFAVRSVSEDDWRQVRSLRLEMLADTPIAYGETLETALRHQEPEWRLRGRRGTDRSSASFAAIEVASGRWIGTMGGYLPTGGEPLLVGVYVAPDFRGAAAGVADLLLDAVEAWADGYGEELFLHVHEDNRRAVRFYEKRGFVDTGRRLAYELEPGGREVEMRKQL